MATNLFEAIDAATIKPAGQILQFPSASNELLAPGGERRDGLGCAVAIRIVLGFELLVALSCYGIWRFLQ